MQRLDSKPTLMFLLHFLMLFTALLLPWPWLADAYTSAFDAAANGILAPINSLSNVKMHFDPPERVTVHGSWKGKLVLEDPNTGKVARTNLDVRGFSYRPLATYLALALAAPLGGNRRTAVILVAGTLFTIALGLFFSALPILARLSSGGAFGVGPGLALRTLYEAMATPVMVYAVPLLVFWALTLACRARTREAQR